MSVQMVFGCSGSGKSRYMLNDVINKSVKDIRAKYIYIVPEQFTMETQKNIVRFHPGGGSVNIDIQSFVRLAQNIFEELGIRMGTILDDTGKSLILRKVLEKNKKGLQVYSGKINREGFVEEIKSVISEFYQYGIDRNELERLVQEKGISPLLRAKLQDIKMIFEAFEEYIGQEYVPSEEILKVLCRYIQDSEIIRNSEIYIDGFTGFTPVQYDLIGLLMKYAGKVTISLTLPSYKVNETVEKEQELFLLSIKTKKRLLKIAGDMQVIVEDPVIMEDKKPVRFSKSPALTHLERYLFRYNRDKFAENQKDISIYGASGIREEILKVVAQIRDLTREGKYRYRDIAIVTGDIESYHNVIEKEMYMAGIPCFVDYKRSIIANPCVEAVRSVLELIRDDMSYESVFRFLRTGMCDISTDDVDIIENIVLARGIRGHKRWSGEWKNVDPHINEIRANIWGMFSAIFEQIGKGQYCVEKITRALYDFMCDMHIEIRLRKYTEMFHENGDLSREKEYSQTYAMVIGLFDKMVELMGEEEISLGEYSEILDAGFNEIKVGVIPPSLDTVVAGDIQRTRLNNVKVLFLVGVNEGIIPKAGKQGGIFTEYDRRIIMEHDVELSPGNRENAFIQKFYLYLNLTKPSEKLFLSYTTMGTDSSVLRPSYLVGEIQKMYDSLEIQSGIRGMDYSLISTDGDAIEYLAENIREMKDGFSDNDTKTEFKEIFAHYLSDDMYHHKLMQIIDAAYYRHYDNPIDRAVATAIYGKNINTSISRLEKFATCAYSHFLQYGLGLKERKLFEINVTDIGNVYHKAIEIFSKYVNEKYSWNTLDEDTRMELVHKSVKEAVDEDELENFNSSARTQYMLERVENITDKTTEVLCSQLKKGCFKPEHFEMKFSPERGAECMCIKIDDEVIMNLRGVVDRVDIYRQDGKVYVKVIDYKSGKKEFDLDAVYDGRQLQLSMYMHAVVAMEQKRYPDDEIIPSAELYYQICDPYVDKYNDKGEDDSLERRKEEFKMKGLLNNDEEILGMIDSDIIENGKSNIVGVTRNKNGKYRIQNSTSTYGFEKLGKYMEQKAAELGGRIINGDVSVNPSRQGSKNGCDYCEFKSICRFEPSIPGYNYRDMSKLKPEDIWKKIIGEDNEVRNSGD